MKVLSLSLLLICCFAAAGFAQNRQPNLMIIPDGYVGWIQVSYGVKGASALPNWKGFRLYKFGRDAKIRTSSLINHGWAKDKYFYSTKKGWKQLSRTAHGGNGMIWAQSTGNSEIGAVDAKGKKIKVRTPETFTAFIGTWRQFRDTKMKRPQSEGANASSP